MSRRAERAKMCPTPSKRAHLTEADAVEAGIERRALDTACHRRPVVLFVYACDCRRWHLTRREYNRDGKRNRRAE